MRLKPVAPLMPQQALRDTAVGGVEITEGMIVFGLMRVDSVSEAHVPQATQFDPQRWLGGDGKPGQVASAAKRISMPFGAGPRICPGRYLALLEMKMAMAVLLQHFDIDRVDTRRRPAAGRADELHDDAGGPAHAAAHTQPASCGLTG